MRPSRTNVGEFHAVAVSRIRALAKECAEPGWDGADARPLDHRAAISAEEFIRALPHELPAPEVSPEPDGSLSLDWIRSRERLFSVSVGTTNRLAYAWLNGTKSGHGTADFDGETIPRRIMEGIVAVVTRYAEVVRC